jgi:uroporphyrinogen decarboxylase
MTQLTTKRLQRRADFSQFLKVLKREGRPAYLPFYEHVASSGFIARRTGTNFDQLKQGDPGFWEIYVDFWLGMGYDCVPMEILPNNPLPEGHGGVSEESEAKVVIRSREDFDKYAWADESSPLDFSQFEYVAKLLPEGAKIVGGVCAGPYEWASMIMGTIGLSYLLADDPELVELVFMKIGALHHSAVRQLATMDCIGALRQGDDLGFKTSTFLSPELLRQLVFPTYKKMAAEAHANGKPFILHSCGNLAAVYDDLIDDCKIDAKHSFEDIILPVEEFKRQYGQRITPLGGLDVDVICRGTEEEIRAYTRGKIEQCFADGYWTLGTGNSLTNYMPVENYIAVLDEGRSILNVG